MELSPVSCYSFLFNRHIFLNISDRNAYHIFYPFSLPTFIIHVISLLGLHHREVTFEFKNKTIIHIITSIGHSYQGSLTET
jgi:hypothetical protein